MGSLLAAALLLSGAAAPFGGQDSTPPGGFTVAPQMLGAAPAADGASAASVALLTERGRVMCSGTLIAPQAVLTAAHCMPFGPDDAPAFHAVCVGTDVTHCAETLRTAGYLRHPAFRPGIYVHDLAIVFLEAPAAVAPARLRSAPVVATDGLRIVGFGRTDPEDGTSTGERRVRSVPILARDGNRVRYPEATCTGDSGGGGFVDGELAAVTSSGPANCRDYGDSELVLGERPFIDAAVASRDAPVGCAAAGGESAGPTVAGLFLLLLLARRRRTFRAAPGAPSSDSVFVFPT